MKHARANPRTIVALDWRRWAGGTARARKAWGQVTIEFALAAVGVVMLGLVAAKAAVWMNQSMVDRNLHYQQTRLAAASTAPGLGFAGPNTPIHLIGPGAEHTPWHGSGGIIPVDHNCGASATAKYTKATTDRTDATTAMNTADTKSTTYKDQANKAADLINAQAPSTPRVCTGDQCKSANWFWGQAQSLQDWLNQLAVDKAALAAAQAALVSAAASLARCPGCMWISHAKSPPTLDCSARDLCQGAWSAVILNLQAQITALQAKIITDQSHIDLICAQTGTGNPWVGGAPASCTPADLQAYAVRVYNTAGTVNAGVTAQVQAVQPLLVQVHDKLLDAEQNERQAPVDCTQR